MRKRIFKMAIIFFVITFLGGKATYAETQVEKVAIGIGSSIGLIPPSGTTILKVTLKSNTSLYYFAPNFGASMLDGEKTVVYGCPGRSVLTISIDSLTQNSNPNPPEEGYKLWVTEVSYCDGTTQSYYDPYPPPPPDPPDDGGGTGGNPPVAGGNLPPTKDWGAVDDSKPANACGGGRWTSPIRNWVDNIFCPVITFLDLARSKLVAVSLMMGQGLNIGQYFKIFGDLPTSWQLVVSSLLLMVATLGGLLIFRSAMRIYYSIKEGVKWW